MSRLLITGAAGAIGRDVTPILAQRHEVRATDLVPSSPPCEFAHADLLDEAAVGRLVEGMDAVLHLAVLLPLGYTTKQFVEVNVTAATMLMSAAAEAGVRDFVYVSTVWATGRGHEEGVFPIDEDTPARPVCMYGHTKYLGELSAEYFARNSDMRVKVLRIAGYERCPEIAPDGSLDWRRVDWPVLVYYATRLGQKLYEPLDMADALDAALGLPGQFCRYIVGLDFPFGPDDRGMVVDDPAAAWERRIPGAAAFFAALGVNPPELPYVYDTRRFAAATGWRPRMGLAYLMRRYNDLHGGKL